MFPIAPEIIKINAQIRRRGCGLVLFRIFLSQKQIKTTKNTLVKVRKSLPYVPKNSKPKAKPLFSTKYIINQGKIEKLSPTSKVVLI